MPMKILSIKQRLRIQINLLFALLIEQTAFAATSFQGVVTLNSINLKGLTNGASHASVQGRFGGGRYSIEVKPTDTMSIVTAYDNTNNYIIARLSHQTTSGGIVDEKPLLDKDLEGTNDIRRRINKVSTNNSSRPDVLPAHIGEGYFPIDGDIYTRALTFVIAQLDPDSPADSIKHDPWIEPRLQPSFEASTLRSESRGLQTNHYYLVNPRLGRKLLSKPQLSEYINLGLSSGDLQKYSQGYADALDAVFTNSCWQFSVSTNAIGHIATAACQTTRFYSTASEHAGKIFETIEINLRLTQDQSDHEVYTPAIGNSVLSVQDHRFSNRTVGVDSIGYGITNGVWRKSDDPALIAIFEKAVESRPAKLVQAIQPSKQLFISTLIISIAAGSSILFYLATNKLNTKK